MKLKEFLEQFEGFDPELEIILVNYNNQSNDIDSESIKINPNQKSCIITFNSSNDFENEDPISDEELNVLTTKAFNDGYYNSKNLNPYPEDSLRWCEYNYYNNRGNVAADQ